MTSNFWPTHPFLCQVLTLREIISFVKLVWFNVNGLIEIDVILSNSWSRPRLAMTSFTMSTHLDSFSGQQGHNVNIWRTNSFCHQSSHLLLLRIGHKINRTNIWQKCWKILCISKFSCPRDCHGEEDDRITFSGRAQPRGSVSEIPGFQELNSLVLFNLRGYSGGPTLVEGREKGSAHLQELFTITFVVNSIKSSACKRTESGINDKAQ